MHEVRSQLGNSTDQWKGLTDTFYEITCGYKVTLCKTQASRFCVVNYEYFDNHSQFSKKIGQSLSSLAAMGLPENYLVWLRTCEFRRLT